jgi:hypothetical protein
VFLGEGAERWPKKKNVAEYHESIRPRRPTHQRTPRESGVPFNEASDFSLA